MRLANPGAVAVVFPVAATLDAGKSSNSMAVARYSVIDEREETIMIELKLRSIAVGCALCVLGIMGLTLPALAHHSVQAEFDIHKEITVVGTVAKIEEINPHSYLTLSVKGPNGIDQMWGFEFGGPRSLRKAGLGRDGLKPGDQVTIEALAAKDGSTNGLLQTVTLDGRVYNLGPTPEELK